MSLMFLLDCLTCFHTTLSAPCPGKPVIDSPALVEVRKEGESVTLMCSAHGFPAPQFTWTPSGKQVDV